MDEDFFFEIRFELQNLCENSIDNVTKRREATNQPVVFVRTISRYNKVSNSGAVDLTSEKVEHVPHRSALGTTD